MSSEQVHYHEILAHADFPREAPGYSSRHGSTSTTPSDEPKPAWLQEPRSHKRWILTGLMGVVFLVVIVGLERSLDENGLYRGTLALKSKGDIEKACMTSADAQPWMDPSSSLNFDHPTVRARGECYRVFSVRSSCP